MTVLMWLMAMLSLYGAADLRLLSKSNGLSDGQVNTIFKDSTGYVWIGTQLALDRFDGNHIRSYQFPGSETGSGSADCPEVALIQNTAAESLRGGIAYGKR